MNRVVFRGRGSFKTIRFQLALEVPHNVFNALELRRQLDVLGERFGTEGVRYELVHVDHVDHFGPQLQDLEGAPMAGEVFDALRPLADVRQDGHHELHIHFGESVLKRSFDMTATIEAPEGLTAGLRYRGPGLLFRDDLWQALFSTSLNYFARADESSYLTWTRTRAALHWFTPRLLGTGLRPSVWVDTDVRTLQRPDLGIERFDWTTLETSLRLGYELRPGMLISLGAGYQYRHLGELKPYEGGQPVSVPDDERNRPYLGAELEMDFDTDEARLDRRHTLRIDGRRNFENPRSWSVGWRYERTFALGWHDLVISSRGRLLAGSVAMPEEVSVGAGLLRGVFVHRYYVNRLAGAGAEMRFSLSRDLFKLSVLMDVATFERRAGEAGGEGWGDASFWGGGFHALIASMWQLNLYYGYGYSFDGGRDRGLSASLRKAF